VFGKIFADIGDEQSIEQSLSTFSSHMTNIIRILRAIDGSTDDRRPTVGQALPELPPPTRDQPETPSAAELERLSNWRKVDPNEWAPLEAVFQEPQPALVLLDELGAGTDPVEGAALARAIIERLLDRGILGIATTHYAELKAFAYATPGVMNSSVEFNVETLAPTYRLTIGLPARSNALAIATRLGLDATLVDRARATMEHEDSHVEDLLAGIHHEREAAALALQRSEELRADAEKYRDRLAEEMRLFEERRESEWQSARDQLDAEMREASSQIRRLRDEFRTVTLSRQWLEEAEKRLQSAKEQAPTEMPGKPKAVPPPKPAEPTGPRPLQIGDTVLVRSVGLMGEILSIDDDERTADVQVGGFRMRAELAELQRQKGVPGGKAAADRRNDTRSSLPATPDVSIEFDMRGWRAADVADRVERYLSDAYLAGLPFVRLIHGKGTGALRQVVRDVLKNNKLVTSFNDASPAEGGAGATVVRLIQQ
jgi:DNA mismatch repair protein MutS2